LPIPTNRLIPVKTVIYWRTSSVRAVTRPMTGVFGSRPRREGEQGCSVLKILAN
jgi:hypothetical protein